ncbi:hypothetical protein IFM89_009271 [Coptis chinensis]|uniref:Uncharacterized protein n=1 Tax=Coptis chinensis TaxID=261450 RepID=A0A835M2I2_9MAGN|nr:hypothetical protein IFM89_009271 [Coptis chinensis]
MPQWLSSCTKLQVLDLSWNRLSGMIPDLFRPLESLFYIDLSNNSFLGNIPGSLTGLRSLIVPYTPSGIPSINPPFYWTKNPPHALQHQMALQLSLSVVASLTGSIWPEFGNLRALHILDLKQNNLSGPTPDTLSSMKSLEVLDLSHNNLSGTIPPFVDQSRFSIAHNHFYGMVPSAGQFPTYPCSSFEGNVGLTNVYCDHSNIPIPAEFPTSEAKPKKHRMAIIDRRALGIGFATGFVPVVGICFMSVFVLPKTKKRSRRTRIRN